ncbi:MAG: hypothetical protein AMXMBFR13_06120 [Phycisphaerae bacterium]
MKNPFESELERLARTLTEQFGVEVICQGDQAWTDGHKIVIPSVTEPMDEGLERMMVGYLDHEMAHVAFSDFQVAQEFEQKHPGYLGLLNVVEDALIERRAMQRWPGVRRNLDMMFRQIRPRVQQLIQRRSPFDRFCTAVYLRLSHHRDMMGLEAKVAGYEDLFALFPSVQDTQGAAELAGTLLERWLNRNPRTSQPQVSHANPPAGNAKQSRDQASSHCSQPTPDVNDGTFGEAPCAGDHSESQGQESHSGDSSSPGTGHGDAAQQRPNVSEGSSCANDGAASPDKATGVSSHEGTQLEGTRQAAANARDGAGVSAVGSLVSEALTGAIAEQVAELSQRQAYRPFTRQSDRIEIVAVADRAEVDALLDTGRDAVRRLRRGLTNALRSAEKRWWRDDQLRGELSPRTLHRLCMDRPRLDIFRVRSIVQGKSTAVSVLLDASGSMSRRKMDVARDAMRVLLEALTELKIATEALTFTTGNAVDISEIMQQTGLDAHKLRERYGRLSNLEIGLIQQFGEPVKAALSRLPKVQGSGLTPLGEAMQIAAARLMNRPETRRILLVLTDGKAGCEGGGEAATIHAQEMAGRIKKAGIELIGVGILDDNIREVVAESIVIQTLEDLPAQLCKLLGRTLKKGLCHVG